MKRFFVVVLALLYYLYFNNPSFAFTLYWFTGAGIRKPAQIIAKLYNETHKDKVEIISGGSGAVLNEMLQTKKGDVYTLVDEVFLKRALKHGIVVKYRKILMLTPVFALKKGDAAKIKSIQDLAKKGVKIAGGNYKTFCLGLTLKEILNKMPQNLREGIEKNIVVKCMNVMQIIGYIKSGSVDAGIVLDKALIRQAGLDYITIPEKYNVHRYGYIALISYSKHPKVAKQLYDFILKHINLYKKFGFTVIPNSNGGERQ